MEIGRQGHLDILELHFYGRRSVFQKDQSPCLTALLLARRSNLSDRGWIDVARRMREHLHRKCINQITVEIIDPRFGQRPILFPCFPGDPIFPLWRQVGRTILDILDLTGVWTIGCYRIGISENRHECPPTILLGVDRRTIRNWKDARETVIRVLDNLGLSMVGVLIQKDTSVFRVDSQSTSTPPSAGNFTKEVHLGYSISPNKIKHSHGTFGGWIELRNTKSGEWVPFGITCSHCVFPPAEDLAPEEVPVFQEWVRNGIAFTDAKASEMLIVDSPSRQDVKRAIEKLAKEIDKIENSSEYQQVEKAKAEGNFVMPFEERKWKIDSDSLKSLKEQRHISNEFFHGNSFVFGPVMAASGLKEKSMETLLIRNPNADLSIKDWALVRPRNRSVGTNNFLSLRHVASRSLVSFL